MAKTKLTMTAGGNIRGSPPRAETPAMEAHATGWEFQVGQKDPLGSVITRIFEVDRGRYVIYATASCPIDCHIMDRDASRNFDTITPAIAKVRNLQGDHADRYPSVTAELARAWALGISGEIEAARNMVAALEVRLSELNTQRGRLQYLAAGFLAVVLLAGAIGIVRMIDNFWLGWGEATVYTLMNVSWFGAIGGLMSVYVGIRKYPVERESGWVENSIFGASRILFAMLASIFLYYLIQSEMLLKAFDVAKNQAAIFALSVVAGFSERWVPNLMRASEDHVAGSLGSADTQSPEKEKKAKWRQPTDALLDGQPNDK